MLGTRCHHLYSNTVPSIRYRPVSCNQSIHKWNWGHLVVILIITFVPLRQSSRRIFFQRQTPQFEISSLYASFVIYNHTIFCHFLPVPYEKSKNNTSSKPHFCLLTSPNQWQYFNKLNHERIDYKRRDSNRCLWLTIKPIQNAKETRAWLGFLSYQMVGQAVALSNKKS